MKGKVEMYWMEYRVLHVYLINKLKMGGFAGERRNDPALSLSLSVCEF